MAVGDIYRVAAVGTVHGHITVNTFHYKLVAGSSGSVTDGEVLSNAFQLSVLSTILNVQSSQFVMKQVEVQKIFPLPVLAVQVFPVTTPGGSDAAPVPDTVALTIQRRGALAGRKNRGRIYIPALSSDRYDETNGRWEAVLAAGAFPAIVSAMVNDVTPVVGDQVFEQVLFNKASGADVAVISGGWDPIPRSQRRRELGVGA